MTGPATQAEWRRDCLLAANRHLETQFQQKPAACLALQISRNYRLLLTHYDQPDIKQLWQLLSKRWWLLYCRERDLPSKALMDFSFQP